MIYTLVLLGNPGEKYARTRHNAARIVASLLTDDFSKLDGLEIFIPETFMNESGRAVAEYLKYHEGREVIVMYDDKDIALGSIRISHDRSDGGHNGLKSIIEHLGTKEFIRIRIGIAPLDEAGEMEQYHGERVQGYVMGNITDADEVKLREIAPLVIGAVKAIVAEGYIKAMERYN